MEMNSVAKIMLAVTLLFVAAMTTTVSSASLAKCGKAKYSGVLARQFTRNLDQVLAELKAKTPADGNFEHVAERRTSGARVFGRASCFSSLTTSVEGCTSCLDKAIKAIKKNCKNSIRATAGSAAAGCSIRYDNVRIKA